MLEMNELREQQLALQTAAAEAALAGGRWQEALSTAIVVLGVDPENETAQRVARRARSVLNRERQRQAAEAARLDEQQAAEVGAEDEAAAVEEAPAEPAGDAVLRVVAEIEGAGRLVVQIDGVLLADVGYQHVERVGMLRRRRAYRGTTTIPGLDVEPGVHHLHYELRPEDGPAQTGTMEVDFPAGDTRTLRLAYYPDTALAAAVE
jgi:hypothetical protein